MKNKYLGFLFKAALVIVLITFLVKKGFISIEATRRAFSQMDEMIPAAICLVITTILGIVRWQWLLRAQDIHLTWARTTQLTLIGNFFNIALPGAVSGDFVKAFYIAREIQGKRARAFGSILFDRVAGVSALVLVSAGALIVGFGSLHDTPLFKTIQFFVAAAALGVLLFFSYLFLVREHHDPLLRTFRKLEQNFPKFGSFTRIYEGLRHYHNHRATVLKSLGVSILIHCLVSYACLCFVHALEPVKLSLVSLFAVVPLGLLVTAIPLAPAGVGTGHAAFGWLFLFLGSKMGANVFSLFVLFQLTVGAIGGLTYLRFRSKVPLEEAPSVIENKLSGSGMPRALCARHALTSAISTKRPRRPGSLASRFVRRRHGQRKKPDL